MSWGCEKCVVGHVLNEETMQCEPTPEECLDFNFKTKNCTTCMPGYTNMFGGMCVKTIPGCISSEYWEEEIMGELVMTCP